jgi:hypothetical protein
MTVDYVVRESGIAVPNSGSHVQLTERIAELELAADDQGWLRLGSGGDDFEFSRPFIGTITRLARLFWLKNPLIQRGVNVKADYVFGRGVNISAKDEQINDVIQEFLDDRRNRAELTSQTARIQKERELTTDGNVFFVFFVHPLTGRIRVRTIDADEITDIVTNPEDAKEPWYYRREYTKRTRSLLTDEAQEERVTVYYRDWRYVAPNAPARIGSIPVVQDAYVYHIKVGGFSNWRFGVSEIYSPLDWAKAYKSFLENWATIVAAYARFAFKMTSKGGPQARQAAVKKLAAAQPGESPANPAPIAGSTIVVDPDVDLSPIRTSGATTSANDGRRLLLMVTAGFGIPETFFGDVSVGTLATAKSLDRPTELMIKNRQQFWADVYHEILEYVVYWAIKAPGGALRAYGDVIKNEYGEDVIAFDDDVNAHIDVDFPAIVEQDMAGYVATVMQARPLLPDDRELARMILTALGENDVDELISAMYPDEPARNTDEPDDDDGADPLAQLDPDLAAAAEALRDGINSLRETLAKPTPAAEASMRV